MKFVSSSGKSVTLPKGENILKRTSVYSATFNKKGKLLLFMPKSNTQWQLPGGGLEEGLKETPQQTAERECFEETGYRIKVTEEKPFYIGSLNFYHTRKGKFYHSTHLIFHAQLLTHYKGKVSNEDEGGKAEWLSLEDLKDEDIHPTNLSIINVLRKEINALQSTGIKKYPI